MDTALPSCPKCGRRLVYRTNQLDRSTFLGCSTWPACDHRQPLPEELRLKALGHPMLPGFDVPFPGGPRGPRTS